MDKLQHFLLCFGVTLVFGWKIGTTFGLTMEFTQAEAGNNPPWKGIFWKRLSSKDSLLDLVADGIGIGLGLLVRYLIFKHWVVI